MVASLIPWPETFINVVFLVVVSSFCFWSNRGRLVLVVGIIYIIGSIRLTQIIIAFGSNYQCHAIQSYYTSQSGVINMIIMIKNVVTTPLQTLTLPFTDIVVS